MTKLKNLPSAKDIEFMSRDEIDAHLDDGHLCEADKRELRKQIRCLDKQERKQEIKPTFIWTIIGVIVMFLTLIISAIILYKQP